MNKLALYLLIVFSGLVCIADEPKAKKVLIIGIDGLRPDALAVAKTPFLDALIKDGAYAEKIVQSADVSVVTSVEKKNAGEYAQAEWEHAGKAAQFLTDDSGDAVFVYFGLVDSMGHTKGFHPEVREYLGAIKFTDQCVGRVLRGLVARKTFANEDWLIIVCTDHGGRGTNHSNGKDIPEVRNVFLIVSGSAAACGKIKEETYLVDVAVTALTHLEVPIDSTWKMDGKAVGLKEHGP